MDNSSQSILLKILSAAELEEVSKNSQEKIEKYFGERFDEYLTAKALGEAAKNDIDKVREEYERKLEDLTSKVQDYEAKLQIGQQNVDELRKQLDSAREEVSKLSEGTKRYESAVAECRRERNIAVDERDSALKMLERRNAEVERLQSDIHIYETQLKAAITAKCEAVEKFDKIQSREDSLNYKEKRMEQERSLMSSQIQSLSEDLTRYQSETVALRRDNSVRHLELETQLAEKTEELKIANSSVAHLNETCAALTERVEELASKLLAQSEDSVKVIDYYKKEIQAKSKLAELFNQDKNDKIGHITELTNAVTELKKLLNQSVEQYGELETRIKGEELRHQQDLEEKEEIIEKLQHELKSANDLLKEAQEESVEKAVERIAPTAAVSSRLIKSNMSLTELYSLYVKSKEDLLLSDKENRRLNLQMNSILQELEEKAPLFKRQSDDYQKMLQVNEELNEQLKNSIAEKVELRDVHQEHAGRIDALTRENKKLKVAQTDLARQVCYLLKEVDRSRGGPSSENEHSINSDVSANEIISKKLVTFSDINELQENNQKLLLLVRDLSEQLENLEEVQTTMTLSSYEAKLANYTKRLKDLQDSQDSQTQMMTICMQQRDRYKKLYVESIKNDSKNISLPADLCSNDQMELVDDDNAPSTSNISVVSGEAIAGKDRKIQELEDKIKQLNENLTQIKNNHEEYRTEKLANEKLMTEQFDSMRLEVRDLTSSNCHLQTSVRYYSEQIKTQQKNASLYKKQISSLEDRNKVYDNVIVKHEHTISRLTDELMRSQEKLSVAEVELRNLRQECRNLQSAEHRLKIERDSLMRERQTNSLVLNNLELIKVSFERSEAEGKMRSEARLDELSRECSALRRRLQEEQDRFREQTADFKRQTDTAKQRMQEEKAVADKLGQELAAARDDIIAKNKKIDDMSRKLQESMTPTKTDNPIAQANKKAREFELKYEEACLEIETLQKQLESSRENAQRYCTMAERSENELKDLHDTYSEYKDKVEKELTNLRNAEVDLKARVNELETDIRLQVTNAQLSTGNTTAHVTKVQSELKESLHKIAELNREMRDWREQNNNLTAQLQAVEKRYGDEMISHSADIQTLAKLKEEVIKMRDQASELIAAKRKAEEGLEEYRRGWESNELKLLAEKEELEKRLSNLDAQNTVLLDQLETISSKLALVNSSAPADESMNDSKTEHSFVDRSLTDDDAPNRDQLLEIIKYLRREKDFAVHSVDTLRAEITRVNSEFDVAKKKLEEANATLTRERNKTESVVLTATKHDELVRKVETNNALADSNRSLRAERDSLSKRVAELTERINKIEDELFPLQEKNREQASKIEEFTSENTSLRTEAVKWRQRAMTLTERSNKNPEEFRRLQHERESLAKMLTTEKESLKQAQEELAAIKAEKQKLDADIANLGRHIQNLLEEKKKTFEEFIQLKQQNARIAHEILEVRNLLLTKEEELKKSNEEVTSKEAQLTESKSKEIQIRKIAKRYKDSYFELKNKLESEGKKMDVENPNDAESQSGADGTGGPSKQESEKELQDRINALTAKIVTLHEENESLRKEIESFRGNSEKDEKKTQLLKDAQIHIKQLTETKNTLIRELAATKNLLQTCEQSRVDHDGNVSSIKSQYETRITKYEQDLEQAKHTAETLNRMTRENEALQHRINQLHRQLGMHQSAKPSTSSASLEKGTAETTPRTANVKPMSGPSGQQSATVTPWRGSETPLASIRPMSVQNSRTAAVLPTSQTSNVAAIQGSSTGSVTALVPPQQQVHTTGNSSGEAMSSSPTSSHTDYMPATSSAAVVVAAIPPMGASQAESSQEAESVQPQGNESSSSQVLVTVGQQQQAVALVSPRVEGISSHIVVPIQSAQAQETNQPSTSGGTSSSTSSSSSNVSVSNHHQASSSNTVTTTQAGGHKRPRDVEGDSSTSNDESSEKLLPQNKRTRIQPGEVAFQGVTESGLDVEYQVPTSSQRDQEDEIIDIDDSEEEDGMADEGNADVDDGPIEDDADNGEGYEMEESYEQEQEIDEGEGDDDNVQSGNNEVEVDDSSEIPNQSGTSSSIQHHVAPDAGTGSQVVEQSADVQIADAQGDEIQQIQAISSGSEAAGSTSQGSPQQSTWRQGTPLSRQQQARYLMLQQGYDETGDDSIVPSTPTFYAPRRADGFSEAVSSPHPQVPHAARFTFSDSSGVRSAGNNEDDDNRVDSEEATRSVPVTPQQISPHRETSTTTVERSPSSTGKSDQSVISSQELVAGPSHSEVTVPEILVTTAAEDTDVTEESASTSESPEVDPSKSDDEINEDEEGVDGVTSEGEKAGVSIDEPEIEEGREAEASTSPRVNTRSRNTRATSSRGQRGNNNRGQQRREQRPTPIVWHPNQELMGQQGGGRNMNQQQLGSSNRGSMFQQQQHARGQRGRRMRRPSGSNFVNNNMRY